jgi:hypothetical protein
VFLQYFVDQFPTGSNATHWRTLHLFVPPRQSAKGDDQDHTDTVAASQPELPDAERIDEFADFSLIEG